MPLSPELVKDINPGLVSSSPENLTVFGNRLFFTASGGGFGRELWVSDASSAGTQLVKDINPGSSDSDPGDLTVYNGRLYFTADGGSTGRELWVSDGTAAGTQLVRDIYPGRRNVLDAEYAPTGLTVFDGRLFFSADDGINGRELWVSDGTAVGTQLFKDIYPGRTDPAFGDRPYDSDPAGFTVLNDKLVFAATEAATSRELWISDGTPAGTQLLKDIHGGSQSFFFGSSPSGFTVLGNTVLGDKVFFSADESVNLTAEELWATDGTTNGTQLVKDINPSIFASNPEGLTVFNDKIIFSAVDRTNGRELWISDGTAAGTQLVKDIFPGNQQSNPENFTVFSSNFFNYQTGYL